MDSVHVKCYIVRMTTATVTVRMDEKLKSQAESLFDEIGLNMSSAITVFVKAAVREGGIPFALSADPFYSASNQARLRRAISQLDAGTGVLHEISED